ncbi:MAG: hypothetical protein EPN43_12470 [Jatrophihabitans sp.]|nr:MAG: hypothetical protein EPN43_12470 [Jatrophihabitans sp.]
MTGALRRAAATAAALALTAALAGCGPQAGPSRPTISDSARVQLQADVLAVSRAFAVNDPSAARAALADLRRDLDAFQTAGAVSTQRAAQIGAVLVRLSGTLPAPQTSSDAGPTTGRSGGHPQPGNGQGHGGNGDSGHDGG